MPRSHTLEQEPGGSQPDDAPEANHTSSQFKVPAYPMQNSKIIEIDGIFLGTAVSLPDQQTWRFVATHPRAHQADGATAPSIAGIQFLARRAYLNALSPLALHDA